MTNRAQAPEFINLDVEVESRHDLTPLARALERSVFILHCQKVGRRFLLRVEPRSKRALVRDPKKCTNVMLAALYNLDEESQLLWDSAITRMFDYGFDSGVNSKPIHFDLAPEDITAIANLHAVVRYTLYPLHTARSQTLD